MYAAVLRQFGAAPVYEQFEDPTPAEGESLIEVRAAALNRVDRARASGGHYTSGDQLPVITGTDGVGTTASGERVWFALPRAPFGGMAQKTVVSSWAQAPLPPNISDAEGAALINPGMAALLPLQWRGNLAEGETVLVLGATGVTGRLAVQLAKQLGAGRVVAAGRNPASLEALRELGADETVQLDQPREALVEAFAAAGGKTGYQVIVDYVWGPATEALLASLVVGEFRESSTETRLVQVGDAGSDTIALPAEVLRSSPVTLVGSGGFAPPQVRGQAYGTLVGLAASGKLRVAVEEVPLSDVEAAWNRGDRDGKRIVLIP